MGEYLQQAYEERDLAVELAEKHGLIKDYKRLQEQLNEANMVIKDYDGFAADLTSDGKGVCKYANSAHLYLEKWGVK